MREKDLISVDHIPLRLDNGMRFGDVIAEEDYMDRIAGLEAANAAAKP
jgi:hypothetical protein